MVNKSDLARFDKLQRIGCICCRMAGHGYAIPEVHHVLSGGRRIGHQATLPLCPHHHRFPNNKTVHGPSLADGSKLFHAHWGTQLELLAKVNSIIERMDKPMDFERELDTQSMEGETL